MGDGDSTTGPQAVLNVLLLPDSAAQTHKSYLDTFYITGSSAEIVVMGKGFSSPIISIKSRYNHTVHSWTDSVSSDNSV